MLSTMQDVPLAVRRLLEHGTSVHGGTSILTAVPGGYRHGTYAQVGVNAARLAHALRELGVGSGDRVGTFMWNNQEHVEAYFAVPAMGAVVHPLNIRLAVEQIGYIANHAEDKVVIVDASLLPVFAAVLPFLKTVEHIIVNGDGTLDTTIPVHDYQRLLAGSPDTYPWPDVDERQAAAMCYTSGTTGDPKGVVYSHRSIYLHALAVALPDGFDLSARDRILAVVPQFHVLAWGIPYAAFLTGASLAMPDRFLGPAPLAEFIATARPTKAAGVPTIWQGLLAHLDATPEADVSSLKEAIVGGSACPPALMEAFERRHGIALVHAWGMTEMSPLGTLARPPAGTDPAVALRYRLTQGRFMAPVEARLVGPDGTVLPHDGHTTGELEVRGPWITGRYHRDDDPAKFDDGWLRTGDIGAISHEGYLTLTDRAKDVIKSGGEWISSVELENHLMAHPAVREAAVIGVPDERWGERPLATVVVERDTVSFDELRTFLAQRGVPGWQLPERWTVIPEVPKTSVGKFDKKVLRQRHADGALDVHELR
ncbi:MAG: long-chain fatty acid--CoA ligase [Actinobacteria bacterium 13_1_20CM_3_71_11]|nr:MAG: long-chain fatty acid--CoA ligase [Actinobacteria bacterium 13_1_20CM_3_71_11]